MSDNYLLLYTGEQVDARLETPLPVVLGGTGQAAKYSSVTVTNNTTTASDHSVYVWFSPYLSACVVRGYAVLNNVAVSKNTWFDVCAVPSGYRPTSTWALAASMYGGADARILPSGVVQIKSDIDIPANDRYDIYFSGMWML